MADVNYQKGINYILSKLLKSWKFILGFTLICLSIGALFYFIKDRKYQSKTTFVLRSPQESERNQVFSNTEFFQNKRYFGDQDDIDELIAISKTYVLRNGILEKFDLGNKYQGREADYVFENLKINRNSTNEITINYTDTDPKLAAEIANYARTYLMWKYEQYFKEYSSQQIKIIQEQVTTIYNRILTVNDSILAIREQYNLTDHLLPTRGESAGSISRTNNLDQSKGLELLSVFTDLKDRLVSEKSNMEAIIYQYEAGLKEGLGQSPFFVLEEAHESQVDELPNPKVLFPGILIVGLIMSIVIVVLRSASQLILSK